MNLNNLNGAGRPQKTGVFGTSYTLLILALWLSNPAGVTIIFPGFLRLLGALKTESPPLVPPFFWGLCLVVGTLVVLCL